MDYEGSASIISESIVSASLINGKISISSGSEFTTKGYRLVNYGKCTCDGIFVSIVDRYHELEARVEVLEELVSEAPTGTDFLEPIDVEPLFNEREVIFNV